MSNHSYNKLTLVIYQQQIKNTNFICLEEPSSYNSSILHQCKKCGDKFLSTPLNIKRGSNACNRCYKKSLTWDTEKYLLELINKDIEIRPLEEYIKSRKKILHKCKLCNYEWTVRPISLLSGSGCPECHNRKTRYEIYKDNPTILYYIYFEELNIWKIGITKRSIKDRYSRDKLKYIVIKEILFEDGFDAVLLESKIIQDNKMVKYSGNKFMLGGETECFTKDIIINVNINIDTLIKDRDRVKTNKKGKKMIKEFEAIRQWKAIRGIGQVDGIDKFKAAISQYNRFMQEGNEILDALVVGDMHEFKDALGDTIVTLVNLAKIMDTELEDGLEQAFDVIELRKGITTPVGDFVRYGKLSDENKDWCDKMQGSTGEQYFTKNQLSVLTSKDFIKEDYSK